MSSHTEIFDETIRYKRHYGLNIALDAVFNFFSDTQYRVKWWPEGYTVKDMHKEAWDLICILASQRLPTHTVRPWKLAAFIENLEAVIELFFPQEGKHVKVHVKVQDKLLSVKLEPLTELGEAFITEVEQRVLARELTS